MSMGWTRRPFDRPLHFGRDEEYNEGPPAYDRGRRDFLGRLRTDLRVRLCPAVSSMPLRSESGTIDTPEPSSALDALSLSPTFTRGNQRELLTGQLSQGRAPRPIKRHDWVWISTQARFLSRSWTTYPTGAKRNAPEC